MAYKVIREKGRQFHCFAYHQISHDDGITELRNALFAGFLPVVKPSQEAHVRKGPDP